MSTAPPAYPLPWKIGLSLLRDALLERPRSFQADARACTRLLSPPIQLINPNHIPAQGPALLLCNHYNRPAFRAWWIALAISASLPLEAHWMMTQGWTFLGPLDHPTRRFFARVAGVYGFTPTPPMPPHPAEAAGRARAVRQVLAYARRAERPVVALAPEGREYPGGVLGPLPPGAGRFIQQLCVHCQPIIPIGVYEDGNRLCLNFGAALYLDLPGQLSPSARDSWVSQQVSSALAEQLPEQLRPRGNIIRSE